MHPRGLAPTECFVTITFESPGGENIQGPACNNVPNQIEAFKYAHRASTSGCKIQENGNFLDILCPVTSLDAVAKSADGHDQDTCEDAGGVFVQGV